MAATSATWIGPGLCHVYYTWSRPAAPRWSAG